MLKMALLMGVAGRATAFGAVGRAAVRTRVTTPSMGFYDFSATTIAGAASKMSDFKGKPVLILNVASL